MYDISMRFIIVTVSRCGLRERSFITGRLVWSQGQNSPLFFLMPHSNN